MPENKLTHLSLRLIKVNTGETTGNIALHLQGIIKHEKASLAGNIDGHHYPRHYRVPGLLVKG